MEYLAKILLFFFLFIKMLCGSFSGHAQTYQCYLYGSITTVDGDIYKGPIRWNDEEVFLTDVFNSSKESNPYLKYINGNDDEEHRSYYRRGRWYDRYSDGARGTVNSKYDRKFECRFGDIKSISVTGRESVSLELKSGKFINLSGGSNDVGSRIWILDHELGLIKLDWDRVDVVDFYLPEKEMSEKFGNPIYGKLTTTKGEFTGFIQWDHDERLLKDKLDGKSRDGDVAIPFDKIKSINKIEGGCRVKLHSERNLELSGKNDVNRDNRGIIVTIPGVGRIDFPWKHFLSLDLTPFPESVAKCYSEFPESERLYGKITSTKGETFEGVIVYDLDEAMDSEILNGLNDKLDFSIPFRNIKIIQPKAYNYCLVELKNGEKLYLGDQTDVSDSNAGILIFTGENHYEFFKWKQIESIEFM